MKDNIDLLEFASRGPLEFISFVIMCLLIAFVIYFLWRTLRDVESYFIESKYIKFELKDGEEPGEEKTDD